MRALTHWSNSYEIQWTACPNCLSFYDHGDEQKEYSTEFWSHVMKDTGYD